MNSIRWTFCETAYPKYNDLIHLAQVINYHKRRMWSIYSEPYSNGFEDDKALEAIHQHMEKIELLYDEYGEMLAMIGLPDRVA